MSETTKIIWSGLTGRTGREAIPIAAEMPDVEIVAGISRTNFNCLDLIIMKVLGNQAESMKPSTRFALQNMIWHQYAEINNPFRTQPRDFDVIVDFSNAEVCCKMIEFAARTGKPLICGTSGLSNNQIAMLYDATNRIPVFRDGNFRFKVKKFIDEAVELAKREKGSLDLYENFYKGKSLPSETSRVIQHKIYEATGRTVEVHSFDTYDPGNWICDWEFQVQRRVSPTAMDQKKLHCRTIGFDELAHDVLEIAKVIKNKPIKKGEFYTLDDIWSELPHEP